MSLSKDNAEVDKNNPNARIFKKLWSNFTISEKIELIVKRYDNNYFIDKE